MTVYWRTFVYNADVDPDRLKRAYLAAALPRSVDHARAVEGTGVAILFRETEEGATKISFRSNGTADVNRVARLFGGGGHVKAAGALLGGTLETNREHVLEAVRQAVGRA